MTTPTPPRRGIAVPAAVAALTLAAAGLVAAAAPGATPAAEPGRDPGAAQPRPAEPGDVAAELPRSWTGAAFTIRSRSELVVDERSTGALHAVDVRRSDGGSGVRAIDRAVPVFRLVQAFDASVTAEQLGGVLRADAEQFASALGGTLGGDAPGEPVTRTIAGVERTGTSRPLQLEAFDDHAVEVFTWAEPDGDATRATGLILRTTPEREALQSEVDAMLATLEIGLIAPTDTVRTRIAGVRVGLPAVYRIVSANPVEAEQVGGIDANLDTLAGRISLRVLQTPLDAAAEQLATQFLADYAEMMDRDRAEGGGERLARGRAVVPVGDGHREVEFERLVLDGNTLVSYRGARTEGRAMIGYGMLTTDQAIGTAAGMVATLATASEDAEDAAPRSATTAWWDGAALSLPFLLEAETGSDAAGERSELWAVPAGERSLASRLEAAVRDRSVVMRQVVGAPADGGDPVAVAEDELAARVAGILGLEPAAEPTVRTAPVAVGDDDARSVRTRFVGEAAGGGPIACVLSVRAADAPDGRPVVLQVATARSAEPFVRAQLGEALAAVAGRVMPARVDMGPGTLALDPARDLLVQEPAATGGGSWLAVHRDGAELTASVAPDRDGTFGALGMRLLAVRVLELSDEPEAEARLEPIEIAGRPAMMLPGAEPFTFGDRPVLRVRAVTRDERGRVWRLLVAVDGDMETAVERARAILTAIEAR